MSVNERDLSNPERGQAPLRKPEEGLGLDKRGGERREAEEKERAKAEAARAARVIRERIAAARAVNPTPRELHWRERFDKGRDQAVQAFEETAGTTEERVLAARTVTSDAADGCRDCFDHGRDAAVRELMGPEGKPK